MRRLLIIMLCWLLVFSPVHSALGATYYVNGDSVGHTINGRTYGVGNDGNAGTSILAPKATITDAITDASDNDDIYVCGAVDSFNGEYLGILTSLEIIDYISDGIVTSKADAGDAQALYNNELGGTVTFSGDGWVFDPNGNAADTFYNRGGSIEFTNASFLDASDSNIRLHSDSTGNTFTGGTFNADGATSEVFDITGINIPISLAGCVADITGGAVLMTGDTTGFALTTPSTANTWNINTTGTFLSLSTSGDYDFDGDTFNVLACNYFVSGATVDTGNFSLQNSEVNFLAAPTTGGVNIQAGTWAIDINTNSYIISAWLDQVDIVFLQNQANPTVTDNTIDVRGAGVSTRANGVSISISAAGAYGDATISGNTYMTYADSNAFQINGQMDQTYTIGAKIFDNTIYGATHYGRSPATNLSHPIFVKYLGDFDVHHNKVYGSSGYGMICKGGDSSGISTASGLGFFSNIIKDSYLYGIYVKGMSGTEVENNIAVERKVRDTKAVFYFGVNDPDHNSLPSTDGTFSGNVADDNDNTLVGVDTGSASGFSSTYNVLYRGGGTNNYGVVGSTTYSDWDGGSGWVDTYTTDINSEPGLSALYPRSRKSITEGGCPGVRVN